MSNFHLTEIALELLGNKIFDINGQQQTDLVDIFASCPKQPIPIKKRNSDGSAASTTPTNLVQPLGIEELALIAKNDKECVEYFSDELMQILKNSAADVHGKCVCSCDTK